MERGYRGAGVEGAAGVEGGGGDTAWRGGIGGQV